MENFQIRRNQLNRKKLREIKKKRNKIKILVGCLAFAVSISAGYLWLFSNGHNASADSAKILSEVEKSKENNEIKEVGFSKDVLSFKKVSSEIKVYSNISDDPKVLLTLNEGKYIQYLGEKDGWSKILYNHTEGYVKSKFLTDVKQNELKVSKGFLIINNTYKVPQDFEINFDVDTENAMMVMFEALEREGLKVSVLRKTIEKPLKDVKLEENTLNFENSMFRGGKTFELTLPTSDSVIDFSTTPEGKWLKENAYKYGFVLTYPKGQENKTGFAGSDTIYTYVGNEAAKEIQSKDISLFEYFLD